MHPYVEHINPYLGRLLQEIGMNKRYKKGEGCYLYDDQGNQILDFIAAYGALPFGFNHPTIWEAINEIQASLEPSFTQPSFLEAAGALAKRLIEIAPANMQYVTYTNSGAEAVEAAIKLVRSRKKKLGILATSNSFHGKTLGALSATGNTGYQKDFGAPVTGFKHIPFGDINALRMELETNGENYAAFIVEPIQGEGGIVLPPKGYLKAVREVCDEFGALLIFDEVQTGLGRTGTMFACFDEGVEPDVMVLAKALGGGIVPIGAVLCTEDVYTEEFGNKHSSTFAGNSIGCRVGLKVIEMLTRNDCELIKEVKKKGELLKNGLLKIQAKYPDIIKEVRGRGLMIGIDLGSDRELYPDSLLGVMAEQEILTPLFSSYLLNTENLRVAPTLNGASVIRIEPPLIISYEQIETALSRIERAVRMLAHRNTAALIGHLVNYKDPDDEDPKPLVRKEIAKPSDDPNEGRFAFLVHPLDLKNYTEFDKSLQVLTDEQLEDISSRWNDMVEPFVVSSTTIVSKTGQSAYGEFIVVPRTADQLVEMSSEQAQSEIIAAVELARSRGAKIVGLGAYTSVVTMGGRSLTGKVDVPITTGNSYTVVSCVESLILGAQKLGMDLNKVTAAVVGAGGAIGKASAVLLSESVSELILIGNPERPEKSEYRMLKVAAEILKYLSDLNKKGVTFSPGAIGHYVGKLIDLPTQDDSLTAWIELVKDLRNKKDFPIKITVDLNKWLPKADLVLAATSNTKAMITSSNLKWGALVCDVSRPANVADEVLDNRKDVLVIDGGVIETPNKADLGWDFGFDKGLAYACMSETMMLGLEQRYENTSIGADLNLDYLNEMRELAQKHGFILAGFRSFNRPIDDLVWQQVISERQSACGA